MWSSLQSPVRRCSHDSWVLRDRGRQICHRHLDHARALVPLVRSKKISFGVLFFPRWPFNTENTRRCTSPNLLELLCGFVSQDACSLTAVLWMRSWIMLTACWTRSPGPVMEHVLSALCPSSGVNCTRAPESCWIFLIMSPPLPMITPTAGRGTRICERDQTSHCQTLIFHWAADLQVQIQ